MVMEMSRGRETTDVKAGQGLNKGLGWFSVGLGLAEIAAPRVLARMIGIQPDGRTRGTMRAFGAREIASGLGILAKPTQPIPLWSRVAGDVIDLAMLAWAMKAKRTHGQRLVGAMVAVVGVAALDVYASQRQQRLQQARPQGQLGKPEIRHMQITINRPDEEVKARWRELAGDLPNIRNVVFRRAPGGRGTEVSVEFHAVNPIKKAIGRLLHTDAEQLADGDLRKIKQLIELGEIVHSDASIHRGMHAAQPSRKGV